jgi:hypothetical protein
MCAKKQNNAESSARHITHIGKVQGPVHTGSGNIYEGITPNDIVDAGRDSRIDEGADPKQVITVLFLAANPSDTQPLRLDEEIRLIDQLLRQSEFRDRFDIRQHWAVRVTDIQGLLLRYQPDVVHFSGHGSPSSEIILEDAQGESRAVPAHALSRLFFVLKDNIRCVVLNACYSENQAKAIAQHIDCVVGMSKSVGDQAAISFASSFYQALGYGRDVQTAFELGCLEIDLENLKEQDTPRLIADRADPKTVLLLRVGSLGA